MNLTPILACGPSVEMYYGILGILGTGALCFVSGIFCLCVGSKSLGAFLVGAPVSLFGLAYLWISHH